MPKQLWKLISVVGVVATLSSCSKAPVASTTSPQVAVNNSPTPLPAPKEVRMTGFQQINGTPYLYAPIYVAAQEQRSIIKEIKSASYESSKGDEYTADIRNYMFVHRDNLSASKLLANNSSRLISLEQIGEPAPPDKSNPDPTRTNWVKTVKALWHVRVLADTNSDKILNDLDRKQIGISDVSGANYTEVIKDIDKILLVYPKGIDRRLVIYTSGNKRFVANIEIPTRQVTIKELPALK
ncbi:hypothetical protein [Chamaesiphon sp. GL140_3_metabinner_50]|uniref:hypothetical protein n=1 Tax=Chamaesiphon sp. GL140_3_metabinner_50 TaxID=2970812 RepID=UPI0025E8F40A|nr:hypothetical protein [Chamaesiphon sp. GL140_3_metabinner_50]